NLLREGVSIRDLVTILEALADHAPRTKDQDALTEHARQSLGRSITKRLVGTDDQLALATLSAAAERMLLESIHRGDDGATLAVEPGLAQRLLARLGEAIEQFATQGLPPVLLCSAALRPHLRRLIERYLPALVIVSPAEISPTVHVRSVGVVSLDE